MITAVKAWAESTGTPELVVRAVETTGRRASARLELPVAGHVIAAEFGPSQLRTFRLPIGAGEVREIDLIERDLPEPKGPFRASEVPRTPIRLAESLPDPAATDATSPAESNAPGQRRHGG
jgi:alpha-mannosidase